MSAYAYNAALYCDACGEAIQERLRKEGVHDDGNTETFPQWTPEGGGESDCPQHCDDCRDFLENPLTSEGYDYVAQAVSKWILHGRGTQEVIEKWVSYYPIDLDTLNGSIDLDDLLALRARICSRAEFLRAKN